jgi:hypothetical protein
MTLDEMDAAAAGETPRSAPVQNRPIAPVVRSGKGMTLDEMDATERQSLPAPTFSPSVGDRFLDSAAYEREKKPAPKALGEPLKNRLAALTDDPRAEKNRLDAAELLSQVTPWQIPFAYNEQGPLADTYFGKQNVQPEETVSKLGPYLNNVLIDREVAKINGRYTLGPLPPEAQKDVDDLKARKEGDTTQGIRKDIADAFVGIIGFGKDTMERAGGVAKNLSETMQGLLSFEIALGNIRIKTFPEGGGPAEISTDPESRIDIPFPKWR